MGRRMGILITLLLLFPMLTGCWDRIEIEDRGFVVALAIDEPKHKKDEGSQDQEAEGKEKKFRVTYQIVSPSGFAGQGGGQTGGEKQASHTNITAEGATMFEIMKSITTRSSRSPYFDHLILILVSEQVARKGRLAEALDFFLRVHEMRRGVKVVVVQGEAKKVLEIQSMSEKIPAFYVDSLTENYIYSTRIRRPLPVGEVEEYAQEKRSFSLPLINLEKNEMKLTGAAVFKGDPLKMTGRLGIDETIAFNLLTNEAVSGLIEFKTDGGIIGLNLDDSSAKVKANVSDPERIKFTIKLNVKGILYEAPEPIDYLNQHEIDKLEKKLAEKVRHLAMNSIRKIQKEYKTDCLNLGVYLKNNHYSLWKKIGNQWESGKNYFANSSIEVKVNATINHPGEINRFRD
jgi:spore germination protein